MTKIFFIIIIGGEKYKMIFTTVINTLIQSAGTSTYTI